MSNTIAAQQKQNTQELNALNDEYRKKRREVVDKSEESIRALKKEYAARAQAEEGSGEAAVNHIKSEAQKKIHAARESTTQKLQEEKKDESSLYILSLRHDLNI